MPKKRKKGITRGGALAGAVVGMGRRMGVPLPKKRKLIMPLGSFPTSRKPSRRRAS